jgi:hypothetical protein
MKFFTRRTMAVLPLLFLFSRTANAQRRSVRGIVMDQRGRPLRGASVKLKSLPTLQIRSYISEKDGGYRFQRLNPDWDYELKADFEGESSHTERLDRFASTFEVVVNLRIELPLQHDAVQCLSDRRHFVQLFPLRSNTV